MTVADTGRALQAAAARRRDRTHIRQIRTPERIRGRTPAETLLRPNVPTGTVQYDVTSTHL